MRQAFDRFHFGIFAALAALLALAVPQAVIAQDAPEAVAEETATPAEAAGGYVPMAPTPGKGMPTSYEDDPLASMTFQDQYSQDGLYALWMHDAILLPVITIISLFVLALLLYVIVKFNRRSNPNPSRTTHNTMIEVVWTVVPVIILVVIAVPSITLLARQYEEPPEDAITVKAVGYQWYWGYEYPDHDVEVISNMLTEEEAIASGEGEQFQMAVDNRMVVPAGVPIRLQTTAADVIHAFAVPSLWFKQDAVPGRLNERMLVIDEPGVYYGQCSELCGALHGYMPIAVEALPMEEFEAWVLENGGSIPGAEVAAEAETEATEEEAAA
ncbi:cytochrome c oxidase subunit II [uncultured Erythrobacter sp.]|uniref:cytochrome c oxidase subunit II n=1 Tax=uncultured Erythrobacter sp. TaxID=263913 RepID=UPI002624DA53|nr:cytochrome c oxidase subunit II [uncultured Erythrobacter sp.]